MFQVMLFQLGIELVNNNYQRTHSLLDVLSSRMLSFYVNVSLSVTKKQIPCRQISESHHQFSGFVFFSYSSCSPYNWAETRSYTVRKHQLYLFCRLLSNARALYSLSDPMRMFFRLRCRVIHKPSAENKNQITSAFAPSSKYAHQLRLIRNVAQLRHIIFSNVMIKSAVTRQPESYCAIRHRFRIALQWFGTKKQENK